MYSPNELIWMTEDSGFLLDEPENVREEWEKAVINALKLTNPRVVNRYVDGTVQCPVCKHLMDFNEYQSLAQPHCPNCGQALVPFKAEDANDRYTIEDLLEIDYFG